jgi:mannose-1-phosphate guanylyltransferase
VAAALRAGDPAAATAEAARIYLTLPSISIDHGVMEHARDVVTVPGVFGWNDIGSWAAVADVRGRDASGNAAGGDAVIVEGGGNLVVAGAGRAVVVVGCSDLIVVDDGDAVLVIPRDRAQDVRLAVDALRARGLDRFL